MLFTHTTFLFYFLPLALLALRITNSFQKGKEFSNASRLTIFLATLVFYGFKQPWWLVPFCFCIAFDFLWAHLLWKAQGTTRKWLCAVSISQNLALLGTFKYWDVFAPALHLPPIELPPGISFYTFESMSFVIDVYRRQTQPPKSPLEFFAFIGMFPRFVAGPIVRYREMVDQFSRYKGMQLGPGLYTFIIGFFLKTCFADNCAQFVNYAFDREGTVQFLSAWVGTLAFTMQIYFDFSGYSLMAIGLGKCLGFQFPTNFNRPYLAVGLSDFWRRWHITLSSWLRDYLYIPLGGNRKGPWRTYLNLFLTMAIGGLWHGSGLPFLIWGAWHGVGLCIERATGIGGRVPRWLHTAGTFLFVVCGWVFFRAKTAGEAIEILSAMAKPWQTGFNDGAIIAHPMAAAFFALSLIYCFAIEARWQPEKLDYLPQLSWPQHAAVMGLFIVALVGTLSAWSIPFIYFQF
jgi:alginate O-acetyltransferase complex protein AlgI